MTSTVSPSIRGAAPGQAAAATAAPPSTPLRGNPLLSILARFRMEAIWLLIFGFFSNALLLTPTLYMMQVFDRVFLSGSEYTLAALSALVLVLFLVMGFSDWARSRLLVRAGARFDEMAQSEVFRATFDAQLRTSGATAQSLGDLTQLRQFLTGNGVFAVMDTPWALVYTAALFLIHPWLGWLALFFIGLTLAVALVGNKLMAPRHQRAQQSLADSNAYLAGKLRSAEAVEAMGMLPQLRRHWIALHDRMSVDAGHAAEGAHRSNAVMKFIQYAQGSLVLALGALLAIDGHITAGAMLACNALMGNALRPIGVVVQTWKSFIDARGAYTRLTRLLLDNPPQPPAAAPEQVQGQITLRGLTARAPKRQAPILDGIDAEFRAGEVVAIVGPSGAGKSTLARCLLGIWPDVDGKVLLDGVPIGDWPREQLGASLGYLPQDIELFDGTIAENIARFAPGAEAAVITAAQRTGIHEMVLRMPKGYDTEMGEAGATLSGGQRQRIGLARAIVSEPRLVVLDEPNANLDDVGEMALIRAVVEMKARGVTVFMIVHQKHLLSVADRVLVLEKGRIAHLGPVRPEPPAAAATPTSTSS